MFKPLRPAGKEDEGAIYPKGKVEVQKIIWTCTCNFLNVFFRLQLINTQNPVQNLLFDWSCYRRNQIQRPKSIGLERSDYNNVTMEKKINGTILQRL
jgi:hypothetical protein